MSPQYEQCTISPSIAARDSVPPHSEKPRRWAKKFRECRGSSAAHILRESACPFLPAFFPLSHESIDSVHAPPRVVAVSSHSIEQAATRTRSVLESMTSFRFVVALPFPPRS